MLAVNNNSISKLLSSQVEKERIRFYFNEFKRCPNCDRAKFSRFSSVKGYKDVCAYGKDCYTCLSCRWTADYLFDQSCKAYYYEPELLGWTDPFASLRKAATALTQSQPEVTLKLLKRVYSSDGKPTNGITTTLVTVNSSTENTCTKILGSKHHIEDDSCSNLRKVRRTKNN